MLWVTTRDGGVAVCLVSWTRWRSMHRRVDVRVSVALIELYQRYISPFKGFRCAYRVATGEASCSEYAKQAIGEHGFWRSLQSIRNRFRQCRHAATRLAELTLANQSGPGDGASEDAEGSENQERENQKSTRGNSGCADPFPCAACGDVGAGDLGGAAACGGGDACACTPV